MLLAAAGLTTDRSFLVPRHLTRPGAIHAIAVCCVGRSTQIFGRSSPTWCIHTLQHDAAIVEIMCRSQVTGRRHCFPCPAADEQTMRSFTLASVLALLAVAAAGAQVDAVDSTLDKLRGDVQQALDDAAAQDPSTQSALIACQRAGCSPPYCARRVCDATCLSTSVHVTHGRTFSLLSLQYQLHLQVVTDAVTLSSEIFLTCAARA